MKKLKDKLLEGLGWFGMAIYFTIYGLTAFAPLLFLDLPFLVDAVIIGIVMFVPFLQNAVRPTIWICAFVAAVRGPIDVFAIIYFVLAAIYAFAFMLQDLLTVIQTLLAFVFAIFKKEK